VKAIKKEQLQHALQNVIKSLKVKVIYVGPKPTPERPIISQEIV